MESIHPCLFFESQALEAAEFYTGIFPDSRINAVSHYSEGMPRPAGTVLTVAFELRGSQLMALNGSPENLFSHGISLVCPCRTQAEIDEYWEKLQEGGGAEVQCGWLKDRFGISWQICPPGISEKLAKGTPEQCARWMAAMMQMIKLDIAKLDEAWRG
jgi:predicted 3-demethylubiquinone-9 3-methyltransferase (glyoxalase superfamily)